MMIKAKQISKKYKIYHEQQDSYGTLVGAISNKFKRFFNRKSKFPSSSYEDYWALKDVHFSIEEGDRVGIIGRNGAGKSTLLKILARIVEPTTGSILIRKRISCLLEVGTGFHPELTGRENIYLNGAILGMSKMEIMKKFDEIVAFSEIENFLDTPVKRFSSGMYMRLGFAIAAHLDPEILIVDEVLAVGDAQFQKKCLNKLDELGGEGRTVIFVSHDVSSVLSLCNKGLYLENGRLIESGPIESCVNTYMRNQPLHTSHWKGDVGDKHIRFTSVKLNYGSDSREFISHGDLVNVEVECEVLTPQSAIVVDVSIWNQRDQFLAKSHTFDKTCKSSIFEKKGKHSISLQINSNQFYEGDYRLKLECSIYNHHKILHDEIILKFPVYHSAKQSDKVIYQDGISLGSNWSS